MFLSCLEDTSLLFVWLCELHTSDLLNADQIMFCSLHYMSSGELTAAVLAAVTYANGSNAVVN